MPNLSWKIQVEEQWMTVRLSKMTGFDDEGDFWH